MLFRIASLALLLAPAAAFNPASVRFATTASKSSRSADDPVARMGYVSSPARAGELSGTQSTNMGMMNGDYGGGYGGMYGGGGYGMGGFGMNGGMSRARQMSYDGSMYSAYGNQGGYGYSGMGGGMGGMSRYGGMGGYGGYGGYGDSRSAAWAASNQTRPSELSLTYHLAVLRVCVRSTCGRGIASRRSAAVPRES